MRTKVITRTEQEAEMRLLHRMVLIVILLLPGAALADVIILESGGAEHSAQEYLGCHAKADAEFLKSARYTLRRRTARASGGIAWVASEAEMHVEKDGKSRVLESTASGWMVVDIHWSLQ